MNRQKLITILATITIMAILSVSLIFTQLRVTAYPTNTYDPDGMTVNGVLHNDTYVLFPYEDKSLKFGFSKYGELIKGELPTKEAAVGLEYDGVDAFANPDVLEKDWSQGWFIDIHYADDDNNYKNFWAFAMYSDLSGSTGIGGAWREGCTEGPTGDPPGGRKTNAWAETAPIKVLYDGPRRFVAVTNTTLYGASAKTSDDALVRITITFVFNKDKKQVVLFKDIKRLALGKWGYTFQVEFSNRGEWDIGTDSPAPPCYAHFYANQTTKYNWEYHDFYNETGCELTGYDVCQMIEKDGDHVGYAAFWPQPFGIEVQDTYSMASSHALESICTIEKNYTWSELDPANGTESTPPNYDTINFTREGWVSSDPYPTGAGEQSDQPMVFKNGKLQFNGTDTEDYIWYTDGDGNQLIEFYDIPVATDRIVIVYKHEKLRQDMTKEGEKPAYVIGEWCFDLEDATGKKMFRAVTVYGLTDRHDAEDIAASGETWSTAANTIDTEVRYLLNETFNPYDLYDAVHKQEYRWLYKETIPETTGETYDVQLTSGLDDDIFQPSGSYFGVPIGTASQTWTGYNYTTIGTATFDWVNNLEGDSVDAHSKNWMAHLNSTGDGWIYSKLSITPAGYGVNVTGGQLNFSSIVDFGFWYYAFAGSLGGPHIEFELYNSTGTGYVTLAAVPNHHKTGGVHDYIETWTRYSLNNISDYAGDSYRNADEAFQIQWLPPAYNDMTDDYDTLIDTYAPPDNRELHSWEWFQERLGSFSVGNIAVTIQHATGIAGECYVDDLSIAYLEKSSGLRYERVYNMEEDKLVPTDWDEYCVFPERVLVDDVLIARTGYEDIDPTYSATAYRPYYVINFELGNMTFYEWSTSTSEYVLWDIEGCRVKVLYSTIEENEKGRYEWMVVGKDAATIDALGAAYMTEAFDSRKDIEVQWTALDINDTVNGPLAPFVMGYGGLTGTKADYRDSLGRPHLRDDWCTTTAISSSNMLFSGGPLANLGAEYYNEFTNAMWMRSEYVVNDTGHASTILALSCWNKNNYTSTLSALYGYAVVSVYKDINGTIGFLIWGHEGQDTYYAAKWFWDTGIVDLQTENRGVTDIILKITYSAANPTHPSVSIVERLGTISEKTPHDC